MHTRSCTLGAVRKAGTYNTEARLCAQDVVSIPFANLDGQGVRAVPTRVALTRAARAQAVYSAFARFRARHSLPRVPQYDRAHARQRADAGAAPPGPARAGGGTRRPRGLAGAGLALGQQRCAERRRRRMMRGPGRAPRRRPTRTRRGARARGRGGRCAAGVGWVKCIRFYRLCWHGTCEHVWASFA